MVEIEQILLVVSISGSQFSWGQALILRALANQQKLNLFLAYNLFCRLAEITNRANLQEINTGFLQSCTFNKFKLSSNWQNLPNSPTPTKLITLFFVLCLSNFRNVDIVTLLC